MNYLEDAAWHIEEVASSIYAIRNEALVSGANEETLDTLLHTHDELIGLAWELAWEEKQEKLESPDEQEGVEVVEPEEEMKFFDEEEETSLTQRLRGLMNEHFVSVGELQGSTGVSKTTIRRILEGKTKNPHARTRRRLESYFGLEEGDLDE